MENVSASFGRTVARGAILAIIVSLLLIVGYISLRFQWKFAAPVLRRPSRTTYLIAIGIYALLGREVDDRDGRRGAHGARLLDLRHDHHLRPYPREHAADEARAVPQIIGNVVALGDRSRARWRRRSSRSCRSARSGCFGGDTLKDFAFALLVGIGAGAYSSIFIAAPLPRDVLKEREPEYKRQAAARTRCDCEAGRVGRLLPSSRRRRSATPAAALRRAPARTARGAPSRRPSSAASASGSRQRRSGRRPHGRAR